MEAAAPVPQSPFEQLRLGREIVLTEAGCLQQVARRLGKEFCRAVEHLHQCRGSVIVCGMGKAGLIGQKIAATLASTGTASHWLHPAEAVHGDLGRVKRDDVVLILSQSGETEEVLRLLPSLEELGVPILAITGSAESTLGHAATAVIELGPIHEAGPLGLAPSASTTVMLAIGDALALVTSQLRGFGREDFARFHPAGNLGWRLSKVEDHMRPLAECRLASEDQTVREVLVAVRVPGRRTGATVLTDAEGRVSGIFTDSDLARLFERRCDQALDRPIREVMTTSPMTARLGWRMTEAVEFMAQRKISELPVVDEEGKPAGVVDITDVVGLLPNDTAFAPRVGPALPKRASAPAVPGWRVFCEPEEGATA